MPKLYIIAGCNGAGKTTASYTVLPEMLGCKEFVNADEFNPEGVAIEAGRLMLQRMDDLLSEGADFAFETTLATRSYVKFIERAHAKGYFVTLLYFWLPTPEQAIERVATRVSKGGHNIPSDVIRRRYANGLRNLTMLYTPVCEVVFQKVCLGRSLQILQICKYSDSWFQNDTPRRVVLIFVL